MPSPSVARRTRLAATIAGLAAVLAAAGCGHTDGSGTLSAPTTAPMPTLTSDPSSKQYFKDGKTYQAWILDVKSGPAFVLDLAHHLVNTPDDQAATKYLESHGKSPGTDGIPNDYIDVDTQVHKTESVAANVTIAVNPDGTAPKNLSLDEFKTWLEKNGVEKITGPRDDYPGAPSYVGPIFAVTFKQDAIVSINQIFEP
jgi:hypothetical protein